MGIRDEDLRALINRGQADMILDTLASIIDDLLVMEDDEEFDQACRTLGEDRNTATVAIQYLLLRLREAIEE